MKNEILSLVRDYAEKRLQPREFIPGKTKVPASGASLSPDDIEALTEAVLQLWYTEGKFCARFRTELSRQFNKRYITLCNSGSSANLLAMRTALEIFPYRDYVITCATNFPTTVAPIYQCGQIPIYIDIDPLTLAPRFDQFQMALNQYKGKISGAIFAHTLGFPFDEQEIDEINPGFTISDCCDALGTELEIGEELVPVGTFSDLSTLSFFPAHHITTGEGGAVMCHHPEISKMLNSISNWGRDCWCSPGQDNTCGKRFEWEWKKLPDHYDHKYTFSTLGYNLKMTEWQAALGFSQIQRLSSFGEKRRENYKYLLRNLFIFKEWLNVGVVFSAGLHSPFGFPIMVDTDAFTADELIAYLEKHKISTRRVFAGNITKQPGYDLPHEKYDLSGSDKVMRDMFWIGCHPSITREMMDYMLEIFDQFFKEKGL